MGSRTVPSGVGRLIVDHHPSPNCGPRRDDLIPRYVVLHHTAMDTAAAAIARLCDPIHEVSAHYVICKAGRVTQLVPEGLRAWHAGAGQWQGQGDINSRSIGIELDNDGQGPFTPALMHSLAGLLRPMLAAWDIPPGHVIAHSDLAPGRKVDPGAWFDWMWLADQGLAGPANPALLDIDDPTAFRAAARAIGYTAPASDADLRQAVHLRHGAS